MESLISDLSVFRIYFVSSEWFSRCPFQVRHKGTKRVFAMKLLSKFEMVSCLTLATVGRPIAGTVNEITSIVWIFIVLFFKRCDIFRLAFCFR